MTNFLTFHALNLNRQSGLHEINHNSFREEVVIYEGDIYPFRPLRRLLFLLIRGLSSPVH